jgi:hypothetical protein
LSDDALAAIFQSPQLQNLEQLDLSHNAFTAAAILQSVVTSSRWRTLCELGLNHCRLDNDAIEALTQVNETPALRSLGLAYNSIGPRGAAALANWPVLARVWHLELHDNVIGDDGLIALAQSSYAGRLLELDLEQDCWNSRTFKFQDRVAQALAESRSLPRLDAIFSGCVDEYHGAALSPGFSKEGLHAIRKSQWMRPAFRAACSDFSRIGDYYEQGEFNEAAELRDHDFRASPPTLNEKEAETGKRGMQQIRSASVFRDTFDPSAPPKISPLDEEDFDEPDIIEGIEYRDATPVTDRSLTLRLSLEDEQRPLANQVGKVLSDTLGDIFKACTLGSFQTGGGSSHLGDDGRTINTEVHFYVGLTKDVQPALQLIREALWWIGAPANTGLGDLPLALDEEPVNTASRFLQLAKPKIARWKVGGESGYRIDRVPFSAEQKETIQSILTEAGGAENAKGWTEVATGDGGQITGYTKYLHDSDEFDTLNLLIEALTPEISRLVHRVLQACDVLLWPMAIAATAEAAQAIDEDWPLVRIFSTPASFHTLLTRGPYHWWTSNKSLA